MSRPRVLALLHLPPPLHGATLLNQRLLDSDLPRRFDLRVVPLRFARDVGDLGRVSPRKLGVALAVLARQAAALATRRPDVGYMALTLEGPGLLRDAVYMHVFRAFRVPYVVHVHTLGLPERVAALPAPARAAVVRGLAGAARVVACSDAQRKQILSVEGVEGVEGRVVRVWNGLEDLPPARTPAEPPAAAPRPQEPLPGPGPGPALRDPNVLFLSNLSPEKGIFTLLDAIPRILAEAPAARFVVAGPWHSPGDEARFRAGLEAANAADRVVLPGRVDDAAKHALLADADVFVFPSHADNLPTAVLEAMRQGLPVVASRTGGVPELLADDAGVLVPPGDAAALARETARVLQRPALARRLGQAARARYEAAFRLDRWVDGMAEVLAAAGGARRGGGSGTDVVARQEVPPAPPGR